MVWYVDACYCCSQLASLHEWLSVFPASSSCSSIQKGLNVRDAGCCFAVTVELSGASSLLAISLPLCSSASQRSGKPSGDQTSSVELS